ncbi:Xylose isomerase-like TIM barrel [Thalassoglobus neptunius]|uniref:Xylose isomerase-like TIM barrel n=1 Tax=Thalassoglobus neptunius TaxID=1938619 RepID=A0A5C5X250_9PLAN|nr:sugar phosphate isomerase/epimerase family protein [Thalassoglobus neptunius]TWT56908.1 Xylose isomerase-like TIM barrel [Thalassoglobus neptunius]
MDQTRRDFVKTAAIGVGATVFGGSPLTQAAEEKRPRRNQGKIFKADKGGGIGSDEKGMIEKLEQYQSLGFDGLEGASPGIPDLNALNRAMKQTGMPVHGVVDMVHWKQRLSDPDPAVREIGRAALEQAVLDSKAIGGTTVLLVPGRVAGENETHDDVWKRSIVEIRKVVPVAKREKIKILVENVWNGFCETPDEFRDYIDEIDSEWVGVYFDIGNVRKFGKPEDWIRILGPRIGKLDVKDWGVENGFCRLGEGDVDWPAVREALAEINYTGWATREGRDNSLEDTANQMDILLDL